jgi:hypothetical protein
MTGLAAGAKVKVRYVDGDRTCTLDVEVTKLWPPDEFSGRVDAIFCNGQITGGQTFNELMGKEKKFRNEDIVLRQT